MTILRRGLKEGEKKGNKSKKRTTKAPSKKNSNTKAPSSAQFLPFKLKSELKAQVNDYCDNPTGYNETTYG